MNDTTTVDLADALKEAQEERDEIREDAKALLRRNEENDEEESLRTLDERYKQLSGRIETFEECLSSWGNGKFLIKKLTFGELMQARDEVANNSFRMSAKGTPEGIPREGFYKIKTLELAIVNTPPEAPSKPQEFPYAVGNWLFERIDEYNTVGSLDMGNFSLEEDLRGEMD